MNGPNHRQGKGGRPYGGKDWNRNITSSWVYGKDIIRKEETILRKKGHGKSLKTYLTP